MSRVRWVARGAFGRKAKEREKGAFVPVLVYTISADTFRLRRHPVFPLRPFDLLATRLCVCLSICLRKNTCKSARAIDLQGGGHGDHRWPSRVRLVSRAIVKIVRGKKGARKKGRCSNHARVDIKAGRC